MQNKKGTLLRRNLTFCELFINLWKKIWRNWAISSMENPLYRLKSYLSGRDLAKKGIAN